MSAIAKHFKKNTKEEAGREEDLDKTSSLMSHIKDRLEAAKTRSIPVELSVESIPGPAYMVNNNFELIWWNEEAGSRLFDNAAELDNVVEERNVIRILMTSGHIKATTGFRDILAAHISAASKRMPRTTLARIYPSLNNEDVLLLEELYKSNEAPEQEVLSHYPIELLEPNRQEKGYNIYVLFFREGVFFTYLPSETDSSSILELLSRRNQVIRDLMKKRRPFLTNLVAMVADLQSSTQICTELPPNEYFELINHIWQSAEPVFRKYYGTHGKHVGDGMVYYFFPQPDCNYILNALQCANELKQLMREITREWRDKKNWLHELQLNIGLTEGQEWFGTYHAGTNIEFTVLGDTINHAARISDFARSGEIWTTKSMLSALSSKERESIRFGIKRKTNTGESVFVSDLYSRISTLVDLNEGQNLKFADIAALPVTEVVDVKQIKQQ